MRYAIGFAVVMLVVSLLFFSGPSREAGLIFWGLLAVILHRWRWMGAERFGLIFRGRAVPEKRRGALAGNEESGKNTYFLKKHR